jgi:hypothetical protein
MFKHSLGPFFGLRAGDSAPRVAWAWAIFTGAMVGLIAIEIGLLWPPLDAVAKIASGSGFVIVIVWALVKREEDALARSISALGTSTPAIRLLLALSAIVALFAPVAHIRCNKAGSLDIGEATVLQCAEGGVLVKPVWGWRPVLHASVRSRAVARRLEPFSTNEIRYPDELHRAVHLMLVAPLGAGLVPRARNPAAVYFVTFTIEGAGGARRRTEPAPLYSDGIYMGPGEPDDEDRKAVSAATKQPGLQAVVVQERELQIDDVVETRFYRSMGETRGLEPCVSSPGAAPRGTLGEDTVWTVDLGEACPP